MAKVLYSVTKNHYVWYRNYAYRSGKTTGSYLYNTSGSRLLGQVTKQGYKDTEWKVKVAKKVDASSEFTHSKWAHSLPTRHIFSASAQTWNAFTKTYDVTNVAGLSWDLPISSSLAGYGLNDAALQDQALARIKKKLSGKIGGADLLVPTVELREMRKLITDASQISTRFLKAFAGIRKTKGRSAIALMQDLWLQYSFAIAPVIADTISAVEAVNSFLTQEKGLHRIRGSASSKFQKSTKQNNPLSNTGWREVKLGEAFYELQYTYTGGVDLTFLTANDYSLAEHLGFSGFWEQAPSIAWELMPFSWVADYFTTVGAYLEDTFVLPAGSLKYLVLSHKYVARIHESMSLEREPVSQFVNHSVGQDSSIPGYAEYVYFKRTVLPALPHRSLRFKSVDEVGRNAVNRLLNLASLLKPGRH